MRIGVLMLAIVLSTPLAARAQGEEAPLEEEAPPSVARRVLTYLPNRVFDLLDVVRLRARLGRGLALSLRASEWADFYLGSYATLYAGLPGPRGRVLPRLPAGLESRSGVEVSAVDATLGGPLAPDYGLYEIGAGVQLTLVGFDVGVEPFEFLDFLAGWALRDPAHDDF